MSTATSVRSARVIVEDVLGRKMTREIWSSNYNKVLPITIQDFDLSAVLPSMFYMFGFGYRRGSGNFLQVFGSDKGTPQQRRRAATIERVSGKLASSREFDGFHDEAEIAILGDMLLSFCLENRKRALGRQEPIIRTAPAHYMASWIDLPTEGNHLRHVPEMIVALLADQQGDYVQPEQEDGVNRFGFRHRAFSENSLLSAFTQGITRGEGLVGLHSAQFQEHVEVGLDQLLMIRLALQLGNAPDKLRGKGGERIPNQRPISQLGTQHFSEDIRSFVQYYADLIPRQAFVELLESCMSTGLTTIITSVAEVLFEWARTGVVRNKGDQYPTPLLVDCSNGVDRGLRTLAEQSMEDFMRQIESVPEILMAMRLLDYRVHTDGLLRRKEFPQDPYATEWLNFLGDLLNGRHEHSGRLLDWFDQTAYELADQLQDEDYPEAAERLRDDQATENPVLRLAETLVYLRGRHNTQGSLRSLLDSCLMTGRPNGIAAGRKVNRMLAVGGARRSGDLRSLVFTDSVLDYLVHRHVLRPGYKAGHKPLSLNSFIKIIKDRYGFYVDQAPPGMTISNEQFRLNRFVLERRLRDLGLLIGVNDAESMKRLRGRFEHR